MTQLPPSPQPPTPTVPVCYRHPKRETYVRCVRCNRPICPECMNEASVGFQCPECVADGRRSQRPARSIFGGGMIGAKGYVTITLIAINVIIGVISLAGGGPRGLFGGGPGGLFGSSTPLTELGGSFGQGQVMVNGQIFLVPAGVADGEYYRLITAMFLHFGVVHLLVNMWALWILGRNLESALGPLRFLALYLVSGIGGNVISLLFHPDGLNAGSSTAIFGLFAALFIFLRRLRRDISGLIPVLVVNILISFLPGISFWGHLGGAVTGAIASFALAYAPAKRRDVAFFGSVAGLLVLFAIAVVAQVNHLQQVMPVSA